jgi:hypothetical protein
LTTPNGRYFRNNHPRFSDCSDPSIYEPAQFKPNADGHIFLLDSDECRMLAAKAGLETERLILMTNPLSCGHVKLGHILPYLPVSVVHALETATEQLPRAFAERINAQMAACFCKRR